MNETTTQTATVTLAQVGAGRTAHFTAEGTDTLCGRPVSRLLDEGAPVKKDKVCKRCTVALEAAAAEAPAAEVEEAAAVEEVPAQDAPAVEAEGAPAEEAPAAEEVQVEDAPAVEETPAPVVEDAPAAEVEVTAYTAALEQLYLNGRDNEDRALYVAPADVLETLPTLRRMPRWNAAEERFTVNKVALILVRDAQGDRVWVRGEADPIRVDAEGAQVDADAPAEPGPVDMAAVLAATRKLRRRREVQRVIDNREAARTWNTPAPVVEETVPPVVEEVPAPVVEETPAPVVETPDAPAAGPEWRTLKGVTAPFQLYGEDHGDWFRPAGDRARCTGEPLTVTRVWMKAGLRFGEDEMGRTLRLQGAATRFWVTVAA
ncbi:hypothetical protein [Streptomyces sp. NPDC007346]|uniref:hypothetical protein n=1 Tax=Streptomyces sp. NPDC007346 TaxID=3154682 RepID=UPI0034515EF9